MQNEWTPPILEEISLCGECTAYSGATPVADEWDEVDSREIDPLEQPPTLIGEMFMRAQTRQMKVKLLGSAAGGGFPQWNC